MRKIEPTNLEQLKTLIRHLPLADFDKLPEIIDEEIINRRNEDEGKITPKRAMEALQSFHDDFYNEEKDGYSQKELRNALRWILTEYEELRKQ
jgi:hypothetical protein